MQKNRRCADWPLWKTLLSLVALHRVAAHHCRLLNCRVRMHRGRYVGCVLYIVAVWVLPTTRYCHGRIEVTSIRILSRLSAIELGRVVRILHACRGLNGIRLPRKSLRIPGVVGHLLTVWVNERRRSSQPLCRQLRLSGYPRIGRFLAP